MINWNESQQEFVIREFKQLLGHTEPYKLENLPAFSYQPNASIMDDEGNYVSFYYNTDMQEWRIESGHPEYRIDVKPLIILSLAEAMKEFQKAYAFQMEGKVK